VIDDLPDRIQQFLAKRLVLALQVQHRDWLRRSSAGTGLNVA